MKIKGYKFLYLFVFAVFLCVVAVNLFSDGMFMDGLLYASISNNMADGLGSFWKPFLSVGLYPEFYEHPPLALGLQSLVFSCFGDSYLIERFYSLGTFIIVAFLICRIWKKISGDIKTGWLPLLLYIAVSNVSWAVSNNMLENTMTVFTCLSFLFYLNAIKRNQIVFLCLSGFSLLLAVLTKGFFGLYLWCVPFFFWFMKKDKRFVSMIKETFVIVAATVLPIVLLYLVSDPAKYNMISYFNKQVLGSIESVQTVNSRFAILGFFLENTIAPLCMTFIFVVVMMLRKVKISLFTENIRPALMLCLIVFSGIFPIMISLKQRPFYILTVYPFFAIALAYYVLPLINYLSERISHRKYKFLWFKISSVALMVLGLSLSVSRINKIGRDADMIIDAHSITSYLGNEKVVGLNPVLFDNWSLHGYFMRNKHISLDANPDNRYQWYLSDENGLSESMSFDYIEIPLDTRKYKLYKRR